MRTLRASLLVLCTIAALACAGDKGHAGKSGDAGPAGVEGTDGLVGHDGAQGSPGAAGSSCTVTDEGDGTKKIACEDGTTATVDDGADGADGADGDAGADGTSCTVTSHANGTKTISCEDGTEATVSDGLRSLVAVVPEPAGVNCPTGGQRVDSGLDDDRDGVLDPAEIDSSAFICKHACTGALVKNFFDLATTTTASLDLGEVTITAAPGNVKVLQFNGLGVVGGASDDLVDGAESLSFTFDGLASELSYSVISAGNENANTTFGDAMVEAFGANGASLGSVAVTPDNTGDKNISALFGGAPISSFVVTAAGDSFRTDHMNFRHCL